MNSSNLIAILRDLAVLLRRGNTEAAEPILQEVAGYLQALMLAGPNANDASFKRAEQTMFAIDEVRTFLSERDFAGAAAAARDAAKEWAAQPIVPPVRK